MCKWNTERPKERMPNSNQTTVVDKKTNTGQKDVSGRVIWKGPRGGLFVMKDGKQVRIPGGTPTTGTPSTTGTKPKKHGTFIDPITHKRVARSKGVMLDKKMYSRESLRQVVAPLSPPTIPKAQTPKAPQGPQVPKPPQVTQQVTQQAPKVPVTQASTNTYTRIHVRVFDHRHVSIGAIPSFSVGVPLNTPMTMISRIFAQKYRELGLNGSDAEYGMYLRYRGNTIPLNRNGSDVLDRYRDPETRYVIIDAIRV